MNDSAFGRIQETMGRYKAFYASSKGGLMTRCVVQWDAPPAPEAWRLDRVDWASRASCRAYALAKLEFVRALWRQAPAVEDDSIPYLQNLAGTGVIGAAFVKDAAVAHEQDTNYLDPPIRDWDRDPARIGFDPENPWYLAQMWMLEALVEQWDGSFGIVPFTHFDPLDLCNQWRGNDLFYDFDDHASELARLLDTATEAILRLEAWTRERWFKAYGFGGCAIGCWTPGTYLSCDAGDLCRPATLRQWGLPHTQRIVDAWGGAFLHHHELGIHQAPVWSDCRGLSLQSLNRDPNTPHLAQEMTEDLLRDSLRVPLGFIATAEEFMGGADMWSQGKCVVSVRCPSLSVANGVMAKARALGG